MSTIVKTYFWLSLIFLTETALPQEDQQRPPGVIEGLQTIVKDGREKLSQEYTKLRSANKIELNPTIDKVKDAKISSLFLRSLFLHSEKKYLEMINLDECHLYSLIENRLLKTALGPIEFLIMEKSGDQFLIRYDQYVAQVYKYKCQRFAQLTKIFNRQNLKKTVTSLNYPTPKTQKECNKIFNDWKKNDYLPYLCKIPATINQGQRAERIKEKVSRSDLARIRALNNKISEANYYLKSLDFFQRNYLENLCEGLEEKDNFCSPYMATDAWSKIINGELSVNYLKYKCLNLYQKAANESLTQQQLMTCASRMKESPDLCTNKSSEGFSSLFPRPNCSLISLALTGSRLNVPYRDCPGQIDNTALTNIHRILAHHNERPIETSQEACQAEANFSYFLLLEEAKNQKNWPLQVCYFDKIENSEVCKDYIPGNLKKSDISEDQVITKILQRSTSLSNSAQCKVVSKSKFNPILLEYKNGCHIVFDENNCSNAYCPKKIFVDEEQIKMLTFKGVMEFDYVPNNWKDQKKSAFKMLEEGFKLKNKRILNRTNLEVYFRQNPNAIIHGIGCAEDIYPAFFRRGAFNQCQPLPFILDGIIDKNDNKMLVMRTAIDDLHSPRLVPWNWVFTAVMKYKNHHPLNQWNLYGIKK